jgi:transcriptional regulator with XRE-family HTH domain
LNPRDSAGECLSLEDLGQLAREARENRGHSQEEAAARLKLEQPNVSNAERGHRNAKKTLFRLICLYTDYEVDETPHYRLIEKE